MSAGLARRSVTAIPHARGHFYAALGAAVQPRAALTVSAWADKFRVLSSKGSGEPGQWRTDRTPYLREIMDCLSASSPVQRVVMMFGAQLGKTEAALGWIGYVIDHAPAPMLAVLPTLEVRKRWVRQRLDPMLTETPALRALVDARARRDGGNAEDMKDFPGGMLVIGGANSAASLASMPIRYVLCDEVDRFPWEVGQEGDPLGLIDERTKTFPRRKVLLVSTPTIKGASRIEGEYLASDMREYQVPCPHCGDFQVLRWKHPDGRYGLTHQESTGAVYYTCEHCGARIDEHHKPQMLARGRWVARHPQRPVRGYQLSGLYSPLGLGFSWPELWRQWQAAHGDTANLKRFVNTTLGETWEEQGDAIDDLMLIARLETYPATVQVALITAGVDVQKDRLEATIVGWGPAEEAWVLEHVIVGGDTTRTETWDELEDELLQWRVDIACVDAGYNTSAVQDWVARHAWAIATKGISGMHRPLVEDERKRRQRLRQRRRKTAAVEPIGVDQGKGMVYARLRRTQPGKEYVHFPNTGAFDDEYFAQLGAEKLVTKVRGTRPVQEWQQTRARNEALDCMVLALAAMKLSGRNLEATSARSTSPDESEPARAPDAARPAAVPSQALAPVATRKPTNLTKPGWSTRL